LQTVSDRKAPSRLFRRGNSPAAVEITASGAIIPHCKRGISLVFQPRAALQQADQARAMAPLSGLRVTPV
jgi:hypothetical protein